MGSESKAFTDASRTVPSQLRIISRLSLGTVFLFASLFISQFAIGQAYPIFNGTVSTCVGAFLDSGGEGALGYSNNENFTYTICPDNPNDAISLNFLTFNLDGTGPAPLDQMTIYDGNSTAAPTLGNYGGNALQGYVVNASPLNSSGCLTIVFRSNSAGVGIFAASITCYTPCQRPTAAAVMSEAAPAMVCIGEAVTFNSTASYAAPGFAIATRRWEWGDGTFQNNAPVVASHSYGAPGYYVAQLYLVDNNGCASTNRVDLEVLVGTEPTFFGTGGDLLGCVGEVLCLDAMVNAITFNELPSGDLGGGVFLADEVGSCFNAELTYTQFDPGQTLNNVNDLLSICINMEHSFIGDLVVNVISPTGQTVTMHQQGGGATFLGIPVDNDLTPNAQGTCWQYCFSPTATNGTWVDNAGGTLPSDTYESLNNLNGLVGSQLNGIWQLQICDLWASDNGFVCDWNIEFNPALFPDLVEFTPVYGTDCDSSSWAGANITSTAGDCQGICTTPPSAGTFPYTYTVTDNFGCTYDTTLSITAIPPAVITAGPDASTCGTPVQLGASVVSGGFPGSCTYQLVLNDSYGDGWSVPSQITVTVNGVPSTFFLATGSTATYNIPVTNGATVILNYTAAGIWNGEQSFILRNSAGAVVYSSPPGPITGNPWSGPAVCPPSGFVYSWTPTTGLSDPNIANPVATVSSTTEYCVTVTQVGHPLCTSTDCMTITVDDPVDPGTDGMITVCENAAAIDLFAELGGTPVAGGTWEDPSEGPHSGSFVPGADPSGIYTYSVTQVGACGSSTATSEVTVTVSPLSNAGIDASITVCSTSGPEDLFAILGGTPDTGGTWSGPSAIVGGSFDPATMLAGNYVYTLAGTAPCPDETATVTVSVNTPPTAGTDGSITLCATDASADLFAQLGGTPAAGGIWSGPSAIAGGMIDPATMLAGDYTYAIAGTAPCPDATAIVSVVINTPPDAGTDGAITLCSTDAAADLFTILGGTPDAGGTWSGPSALSSGSFNPATMLAGDYVYTVAGTAPCPDETGTVSVTVNTPPDAGTDGSITLCATDAAADLFAQLGGTPSAGGSWSGPSAVAGGMINPATMLAGDYTYTVAGTAPCPDATAIVSVVINTPPDAGTDGAITLCSTDASADLFTVLSGTPDAGGTWSGPSALASGSFDPATMLAGDYVYTVAGTAPCPDETATVSVTVNTPPTAGTDGSITLCATDAAADLFAQLGGTPDAVGIWSGPSAVAGGMIDPATMLAGDYTYTVAGTAPCPDATAIVSVVINTPPDAGTDGAITLCSTDASADLFTILGGTPDAGGTWSGPSVLASGSFDPASMLAGNYVYTIAGTAPCPDETATVSVTVNTPPDAGTDGSITLCATDAAADLFAQLGGTPSAGGAWSGPSAVAGGMINPATMLAGDYTYTIAGTAPCPDATAIVSVVINTPPDAGSDGSLTLCSTDATADLFTILGGTPDAGGIWSGPSALASGSFDPATMLAGDYVYTVAGTAPCPDETATVSVTVNTPPTAGTDGSITLCATDAAADLFAQLGGTPDAVGIWSGPSAVAGGMIDPATMLAGYYTYTVAGTALCPDATAIVSVVINTPPDAGTNGSVALCISSAPISLLGELGGSPDATGTWSGPSVITAGLFNPATMSNGDYVYTVAGIAPCPSTSATVTVNVVTNPDPGTPGAATLCTTGSAIDLFSLIGGTPDAGGTWSGPSAVVAGEFDPSAMNAGVYTYSIAVPPPCTSVSSTVTISLVQPPNAGADADLTLCISSPATSLLAALNGTPDATGTWSGPSAVAGGMFDPATMSNGDYVYTVAGIAPCPATSATVTVNVVTNPDPGTPGDATLCTTGVAVDLFSLIGGTPDAGGTWSGPSAVVAGEFDPASMSAGVYTYSILVPPPCTSVSSTVTITLVQPPSAGADAALTLCISSPATSLLAALNGTPDATGTWSGPSAVAGGLFNPATMSNGDYVYTVAGIAPCPATSATVTVNVVTNPDPGTPGAATLCTSGSAVDLFSLIGGTPDAGGAWSGPSAVVAGEFDPATMSAGVYTYSISVPPPCTSVSSTVTITLVQPPNAGADAALTLCISSPATSLLAALNGSPDATGTWSGPSVITAGLFNPATMSNGDYVYTVAGIAPCPSTSATVTVNVVTNPDPGTPGAATICTSGSAVDLFGLIGGTPDAGGTWSGPSAVVAGEFNPATMSAGVYTYSILVPPPCTSVSSTVTFTLVQPPNAGADAALTLCISSPATSLLAALNGTPDATGTWSGPSVITAGLFNPATMSNGDYVYTVAGIAPCPSTSATVTVNVVTNPDPGTPGAATLCTTGSALDLFSLIGGTPDAGGTWSGPSAVVAGEFDPSAMNAGVYTYSIAVPPPCTSVSSTITITLVQPPNAGADADLTLCISSPATSLLAALNGTPDATGTWSGPSVVAGGMFNPATMSNGDYVYTVAGIAPCPSTSATVTVNVVTNPDPGTPGAATLCTTGSAIDLFSLIGGTPDAGGTWSGPSAVVAGEFDPSAMNAGVYTYSIAVPPPCTSVSSTVTISLVQPPNAGADAALTLCISSPATSLLAALNGTPDATGTWSGPSAVAGGMFNPATMSNGDYVYTVAGIAPCPAETSTVTVTVVDAPDAGIHGTVTLCLSDAPISLFDQLGGTPDVGGSWSGPSAAVDGMFDPATMAVGVYTYTITVPPPCVNASSTVTVSVVQLANAGTDGVLTLCISSPATALFPSLGGTPDLGGAWTGPSATSAGSFDPATMNAGTYMYTVAGTSPCLADIAEVQVTVVATPYPGGPGFLTTCSTDGTSDLFSLLEGTPDAGGIWTGPGGGVVTADFDPSTDPSGVYTYTINVPPPCVSVSSTVTVDLVVPPNAGVDADLTLCISSPATPLFPLLGSTSEAGGTWTTSAGGVFSGTFDPALHSAGIFIYTAAGDAPCPADVAEVEVFVVSTPDPGIDGTATVCASDASFELFDHLGGTPDGGGIWTGPTGSTFAGPFNPALHAAGDYTYSISAPPPCASVSSMVTVTIVPPPDAGTDGSITVCATGAAVDLFTILQGAPQNTGTWSGPMGAGWDGTFDPATDVPGVYVYQVEGNVPCPAAMAEVTVNVTDEPSAGNNAIVNLCITSDPVDLFPSLGGADPGGYWTSPGGGTFSGIFTPGTDQSGPHVYTVIGTAPCPSAQATVTVAQLTDPDAGDDGALALCANNGAFDPFSALLGTPDAGGNWYAPNGTSVTTPLNAANAGSGSYMYVLTISPPCVNDTAFVALIIVPTVDAGVSDSLFVCSNEGVVDLFAALGGTPNSGGTWNGPGGDTTGTFDPSSSTPGNYVYTVTGTSPCPNASATISMDLEPLPDAGTNGSITVCPEHAPVDLFSLLGGTPDSGGTWTGPGGISNNGTYIPITDPIGPYTYTVFGTICPDASASSTVQVFAVPVPNAGPDQIVCSLMTTLDATGTWASGSWASTSGIAFGAPTTPDGTVTAAQGGAYTLVWNVITAEGCAASDTISITFTDPIVPSTLTVDAICYGACDGTVTVTATGGNTNNGNFVYQWSNALAGNVATATGICAGDYVVTVLDTNACSTALPFTIGEPVPLVIDAISTVAETCPGSCDGSLSVIDPEGVDYTVQGTIQSSNTFTGLCPGTYVVIMTDANGCVAVSGGLVPSPPPVVANFLFSPDTVFVDAPYVSFTNLSSTNSVTFTWDFGGEGSTNEPSPGFNFPGGLGGDYTVCLTAMDVNGCTDDTCAVITVLDRLLVFVPNSFTPNGDGVNDGFLPIFNTDAVEDYHFLVFNRWGEEIFNTELPGKPWNGEYSNVSSKVEVYVWKLTAKDKYSGDLIEEIGHVTLLR